MARPVKAQFRTRIVGLEYVKGSELKASPKNWRTHPETQRAALNDAMKEVGIADAVVARKLKNGKLQLIDGHLRADVLANEKVPVLVLDVTEAEADTLLATMDPIAALAGKDEKALAKLAGILKTDSQVLKALVASQRKDAGALEHLKKTTTVVEEDRPAPEKCAACGRPFPRAAKNG